ncbi:response regulator [bacterium]|nr:response regulator [bacterium]
MENLGKILAVDDSSGWRNFHVQMIKEIYGDKYSIETAESAREGYDKVYNNMEKPYQLIITDLQMEIDFEPKYAGEWLTEQIKLLSAYSKTPIILISGTYNIDMIAQNLGVNCLPKRIAVNDLNSYKLALEEALN